MTVAKQASEFRKTGTMPTTLQHNCVLLISFAVLAGAPFGPSATMAGSTENPARDEATWQERSAAYARIMSQVRWTPVAEGIPAHPRRRDRYFEPGRTYTGVPYSNGGHDGRYIGFDIFLKTFLAAVENPESVLYTEDLRGQRTNSGAYYGLVCSAYTSYALQSAIMHPSRGHIPPHRDGMEAVEPQSAQAAEVGDVIFMPGHVEIVTQVARTENGEVTHVRWEDSAPPTTRTRQGDPSRLDDYLSRRNATLYRITDLDAWRGDGKAENHRFPDYQADSATPEINRVLLLDRGDWVPYRKGEPVKFNVMDRDGQGVERLVIKREGEVVETIELDGPGIVERVFEATGDYTAHCVMKDGAASQACEFSVCEIESRPASETVSFGELWAIEFSAENMDVTLVQIASHGDIRSGDAYVAPRHIWLTDDDRRQGRVLIPADAISTTGEVGFIVWGENRYGRLRNRHSVTVVE